MVNMNNEFQLGQYKSVIAILMMINILLIAITSIWVFIFFGNGYVQKDLKMCLPCECLGLHPEDHFVGIEMVGNNGLRCCASNISYLQTLIDLYADYWIRKKHTQECSHSGQNDNDAKPVIKVVGLTNRQMGQNDLIVWAEEHALQIHNDDIEYNRGFIEIKKPGLHQVYSQVTFEKDDSWREKGTMKNESAFIFQHFIILIENKSIPYITVTERTLLARTYDAKTCRSDSNFPNVTSFLEGIFFVKDGDKLGVKVSNLDYVKPQPYKTLFGVHMTGRQHQHKQQSVE